MKRALRAGLFAVAALAGGLVPGATAATGSFAEATHPGVDGSPTLEYWLYVPASMPPAGERSLVVYLHGCTQTGPDAAVGTRWNDIADQHGFLVVYPEQSPAYNGTQCWNWFLPDHQSRGAGEPASIAGIASQVAAGHGVDPARVYVAGASAGADMATIVAATYPEVFAAVAPFAGCAYLTCADIAGTAAHAVMGTRARVAPAFVVQGTADPLNNGAMGETAVTQWVGTNDRADDGEANGSVPSNPSETEHRDVDERLVANVGTAGDVCVRNKQFPCAAGATGWSAYPVTVRRYRGADDCVVVESWLIHGLSHDYPGGDPRGSFTDPAGPDLTAATWAFFDGHRNGTPCGG